MVLRLVPGQTPVPLLTSVPCVTLRSFVPGETLDRIIEYALKDVGVHILICSALYTDASGERKYFRKFFKFQVNNPLSMKSKTHTLAGSNEVPAEVPAHFTSLQDPAAAECHMSLTLLLIFLVHVTLRCQVVIETQLQNVMARQIFLRSVDILSSPQALPTPKPKP